MLRASDSASVDQRAGDTRLADDTRSADGAGRVDATPRADGAGDGHIRDDSSSPAADGFAVDSGRDGSAADGASCRIGAPPSGPVLSGTVDSTAASFQPPTSGNRSSGGFFVSGTASSGLYFQIELDESSTGSYSCAVDKVQLLLGASGKSYLADNTRGSCTVQLVVFGGSGKRAAGCISGTLGNRQNTTDTRSVDLTFDVTLP